MPRWQNVFIKSILHCKNGNCHTVYDFYDFNAYTWNVGFTEQKAINTATLFSSPTSHERATISNIRQLEHLITAFYGDKQQLKHSSSALLSLCEGIHPHICIGDPTIIGSDNGLSPDRRKVIIWTTAGILSIKPVETPCVFVWIH